MDSAGFLAIVSKAWDWIKSQLPAIVLSLFEYEENQIDTEKVKEQNLELEIQERDHEREIEDGAANLSDADIVSSEIVRGGGAVSDLSPLSKLGTKPDPSSKN